MIDNEIEKLREQFKARRERIQAESRAFQKQVERAISSLPKVLGRQNDLSDPKNICIVYQWDAGDGNIIYTRQGLKSTPLSPAQIQSLSKKITDERNQFSSLSFGEQNQIRQGFEEARGKAGIATPYQDFLRSVALGQKFQKLQQVRSSR